MQLLNQLFNGAQNQSNTNIGATGMEGIQGGQQGLVQALQAQMNGQGVNLGQTQLQQGLNQNNQQAAGLIAGQRGLSPQLAARQILQNTAQNNQASSNQAAQLGQKQQLGAQAELGGALQQEGATQQGINQLNQNVAQQNQAAQNGTDISKMQQGAANSVAQAAPAIGSAVAGLFAHGGQVAEKVPALVSPGEMVVPPGGSPEDGQMVPGQAKVAGDSEQNDTVPMKLDEGAIVVPRTVTQSLDPKRVAEFMAAVKGEKKPASSGYGKVVDAKKKWKGGKV